MDDKKQGSRCLYCGGRLVSHFVHNAAGGLLDGLHCDRCGLRYAFAPKGAVADHPSIGRDANLGR